MRGWLHRARVFSIDMEYGTMVTLIHLVFFLRTSIIISGFDCSSPRVCCGTDTDRYCCILSTSPTSSQTSSTSDDLVYHTSTNFLSEKWLFLQICTIGLFLAITVLIFIMVYQCLISIRRNRQCQQQRMSIIQVPLPAASPLLIERNRHTSNRISTISSTPSDVKSRCTDTSIILNTPLNLYPTGNSRCSTSTSSSYYMFPNEFEQLCK
jgi:hypothetical protein